MTDSRMSGMLPGILKYLLLAVFVVILVMRSSGARVSATPFEEMEQAVTSAASLEPMARAENQMIRRLYNLDPEEYEGILLYYPASNMGAEELLLVKLADTAQQDVVREAIEARLATQLNTFEGYGPDQVAMLERSVTEVAGNYILFVVAEDTESVRTAFSNAL